MTSLPPDRLILVTGATGKSGRRIAERLLNAGRRVRLGSRSAEPRFDWADSRTWDAALDGVAAVYVAYQPDLAEPGALETVTAFFSRAKEAGVSRIVLLSGRGEPVAEAAEAALKESGVDWTILRAAWFMQNFSEAFFLDLVRSGEVILPTGMAAEPFIDLEDLADAAVVALTEDGHARRLYEVTGPEALTFDDAIRQIADAAGFNVPVSHIPPDEYAALLRRTGVPEVEVGLWLYMFTTILDGRNTPTAPGIQQALGRPASTFAAYAERTAATGVWAKEPVLG